MAKTSSTPRRAEAHAEKPVAEHAVEQHEHGFLQDAESAGPFPRSMRRKRKLKLAWKRPEFFIAEKQRR